MLSFFACFGAACAKGKSGRSPFVQAGKTEPKFNQSSRVCGFTQTGENFEKVARRSSEGLNMPDKRQAFRDSAADFEELRLRPHRPPPLFRMPGLHPDMPKAASTAARGVRRDHDPNSAWHTPRWSGQELSSVHIQNQSSPAAAGLLGS